MVKGNWVSEGHGAYFSCQEIHPNKKTSRNFLDVFLFIYFLLKSTKR